MYIWSLCSRKSLQPSQRHIPATTTPCGALQLVVLLHAHPRSSIEALEHYATGVVAHQIETLPLRSQHRQDHDTSHRLDTVSASCAIVPSSIATAHVAVLIHVNNLARLSCRTSACVWFTDGSLASSSSRMPLRPFSVYVNRLRISHPVSLVSIHFSRRSLELSLVTMVWPRRVGLRLNPIRARRPRCCMRHYRRRDARCISHD
ncbi:hypothetical protein P171DRAFT_140233 [Karstenula rhodostoma CBS 690.94]|uniref:Uncharacterized protein n=1 Tax=Karstenula rhodostoma CBS 690.94 TaxID=1392251 RepID=A0A9P4UHQ3_9PLEO|nr:hypothetical protein P171DRAFT_140233 [Karstenula rhodostoma CBS 690.94]